MTKQGTSAGESPRADYGLTGLQLSRLHRRACHLAEQGNLVAARRGLETLNVRTTDLRVKAWIANDLTALAALAGDLQTALDAFRGAGPFPSDASASSLNLQLLEIDLDGNLGTATIKAPLLPVPSPPANAPVRVALLSFLFNWPSTGGGTVHTAELARFLADAGHEVLHIYARHPAWGVGRVESPTPYPSQALEFDDASWTLPQLQARFRQAVDAFAPDHVIITDSWNMKPLLAEAVRGYPTILRFQALECLCPLNNVRLLPDPGGEVRQCPLHQLANPAECDQCVRTRGHLSGSLHQAERDLAGVGTPVYHEKLLRAFREAEAVLVVNPLAEAMVSPYARSVRVVTAGMDPARFPWPPPARPTGPSPRKTLLFAGLVDEWMKGFRVLHEACRLLRAKRRDFELVATADPPGTVDEFTRYIGWQSQDDLPARLYACDVLVMPTIAQEALGRTAVEAMAAGRPVVASRIGGLPFTVIDGATGLLAEPGDPVDLARQLERLLDDPELCDRLGRAGRRRFEEHYAWPVIIEKHYKPLLTPRKFERPAIVPPPTAYAPVIPDRVDQARLLDDAARFFGRDRAHMAETFQAYREFHTSQGYERTLGEYKTLCFEEAFLIAVAASLTRPATIVEVGTQFGKSTRRLLDMVSWLGLNARVLCFDTVDQVRYFGPQEARLTVTDLTGRFRRDVLDAHQPSLIFLDVHAHALLHEAIVETMDQGNCLLAIHDCGRGLCNPHMTIARDDPNVSSLTGIWERHVLAELFGIEGPLDPRLDDCENASHRLRIFDTPHGLALIAPKAWTDVAPAP